MPRTKKTETPNLKCKRCGYVWESRKDLKIKDNEPKRCPGCKTDLWNKEVWRKDHSLFVRKWHARRRVGNLPNKKVEKTPT